MRTEEMFHELLGLGQDWEVYECSFDKVEGVHLRIREKAHLWEHIRCPRCGKKATCYDHTQELSWRHLNVFEYRCQISCLLPRGRCSDDSCHHTFRVSAPWEGLSMHFTQGFEAFALLLMREMPVKKAAELLGEQDTRLWRILEKHVEASREQQDYSNVKVLGVDEMNIRKGHSYISVFADLFRKRVLYATEGKDAATWARFSIELQEHKGNPDAITLVSMDMSPAYQCGARNYCHLAQIVFDKFHVIKQVNEAVDKIRRTEMRWWKDGYETLKKSRWIWLKNPENLTLKEQVQMGKLQEKKLYTAKAYQMKLYLQDIYTQTSEETARKKFRFWCRWVRLVHRSIKSGILEPMRKVAQMIENHLEGILAYWKTQTTNAFMEAINSVFSAIKRRARGFRSISYLTTMLYFLFGKLTIPAFPLSFHSK